MWEDNATIHKLKYNCQTRRKFFPTYIKEGSFHLYTKNICTDGQ